MVTGIGADPGAAPDLARPATHPEFRND